MLSLTGQDLCYHREMPFQMWPSGKADSKKRKKETPAHNRIQEGHDLIHLGTKPSGPHVSYFTAKKQMNCPSVQGWEDKWVPFEPPL